MDCIYGETTACDVSPDYVFGDTLVQHVLLQGIGSEWLLIGKSGFVWGVTVQSSCDESSYP